VIPSSPFPHSPGSLRHSPCLLPLQSKSIERCKKTGATPRQRTITYDLDDSFALLWRELVHLLIGQR
jgi:hypothetical protein